MAGSLDLLPFQPVRFGFNAETCANNDNRAYCKLVQDGDLLQWQVRRLPGIGTTLNCSLTDVSSTQILANPGFTGSAASWTLSGWTYGANAIGIAIASGSVTQTAASLVTGGMYKVEIVTTATLTGGPIIVTLGGDTIGTIESTAVAGTYTFFGIAGSGSSDIELTNAAATCTITSINMYRVAPCFIFTLTSGTYSYDAVAGLSIDGTLNIDVTLDLESAIPYSIQTNFFLSNYFTGIFNILYDADLQSKEPSNGDNVYVTNGTNYTTLGLSFQDFYGTVNSLSFLQPYTEYAFVLQDLDGNFVFDLTPSVSFCREWVSGSIDLLDEGIEHGCYQIALYDPALHLAEILEFDYDFTASPPAWTESPGADWTLGGTGYHYVGSGASGNITKAVTSAANFTPAWFKMRLDTAAVTPAGASIAYTQNITEGVYQTTFSGTLTANSVIRNVDQYEPNVEWDTTQTLGIALAGQAGDDALITAANFKIYVYSQDYLSNCISFKETHPCTKEFEGLPGVNMGFNSSNCAFTMVQRFRCAFINPKYEIKGDDFIASDGTRVLIAGNLQKIQTLLIDYMDEVGMDALAGFKMCKTLEIDGVRYFALPQDLNPEWEKDGKLNLAQARILLLEYDQVKFVTNCG